MKEKGTPATIKVGVIEGGTLAKGGPWIGASDAARITGLDGKTLGRHADAGLISTNERGRFGKRLYSLNEIRRLRAAIDSLNLRRPQAARVYLEQERRRHGPRPGRSRPNTS
jgi:hypothetical protein